MFSACCCSWLWVLKRDSLVTPSTSWATSAPKRSSTSVRLYSVSSGTSWRSAAWMAIGSMPELGQDLGRGDRVGDVRLAGRARAGRCAPRPPGRRPRPTGSRSAPGMLLEDRGLERRRGAPRDPVRSACCGGRADGAARAAGRRRGAVRSRRRPWSSAWRSSSRSSWRGRGGSSAVLPSVARIAAAQPNPARSQRGLGLGALVPRLRAVRADDRPLVALAGEQHDVAGPGALEGGVDGGAPVGDEQQVLAAPPAGRLRAARDLVEDRRRGPRRADPRRSRRRAGRARRRSGPSAAAWPVSRSPAEPKTAISPPPRAAAAGASRSRTVWSEAGLWAKSTMTPNGWPTSIRSIRPGTTGDRGETRRGPRPDRARAPRRGRRPRARCGR